MMLLAWICFIIAAILLGIDMVRTAFSLSSIAMMLIALGLAITVWPAGLGS